MFYLCDQWHMNVIAAHSVAFVPSSPSQQGRPLEHVRTIVVHLRSRCHQAMPATSEGWKALSEFQILGGQGVDWLTFEEEKMPLFACIRNFTLGASCFARALVCALYLAVSAVRQNTPAGQT